jgi:hypothetical protein
VEHVGVCDDDVARRELVSLAVEKDEAAPTVAKLNFKIFVPVAFLAVMHVASRNVRVEQKGKPLVKDFVVLASRSEHVFLLVSNIVLILSNIGG